MEGKKITTMKTLTQILNDLKQRNDLGRLEKTRREFGKVLENVSGRIQILKKKPELTEQELHLLETLESCMIQAEKNMSFIAQTIDEVKGKVHIIIYPETKQ